MRAGWQIRDKSSNKPCKSYQGRRMPMKCSFHDVSEAFNTDKVALPVVEILHISIGKKSLWLVVGQVPATTTTNVTKLT